jgi:hypothetical protein
MQSGQKRKRSRFRCGLRKRGKTLEDRKFDLWQLAYFVACGLYFGYLYGRMSAASDAAADRRESRLFQLQCRVDKLEGADVN